MKLFKCTLFVILLLCITSIPYAKTILIGNKPTYKNNNVERELSDINVLLPETVFRLFPKLFFYSK